MNIALTKHFEELIARLVASGRYNNSSEVVRRLANSGRRGKVRSGGFVSARLAATSLHQDDNRAERRTAKASTLKVEAE